MQRCISGTRLFERALIERTKKGPVRWDMILTIGEPGDPETIRQFYWPKTRKEVNAGYAYDHIGDSIGRAGSYKINYDPLVMADGIAPTDDPVLLFRSPSYGHVLHPTAARLVIVIATNVV